jgi:hypothetical protein
MGSMKILDASGHTTVEYDATNTDAALKALAETNRFATVFDAVTKEKVDRTAGDDVVLQEHEELIVVPVMAGGR